MVIRISSRKSSDSPWKVRNAAAGVFFIAGCLVICYTGVMYFETAVYQMAEASRLEASLSAAKPSRLPDPVLQGPRRAVDRGFPFGRIEIPRIRVSAVVVEGVTTRNLRVAVGHMPGTAFPGDSGNVAIAGHRDSFFRNLRYVRVNDTILLTTLYGVYQYSVTEIKVVQPDDLSVIGHFEDPVLTLITCYPFYFAGPAPQRFIVHARPASAGEPPLSAAPGSTGLVEQAPRSEPNRRLLDVDSWLDIKPTSRWPRLSIE
jgi:sortase A